MVVEAYRSVPAGWTGHLGAMAGRSQAHRMDTKQPMKWLRDNRPLLAPLFLGMIVFFVPAAMLLDRRPAVETHLWIEPPVVMPGQRFQAVWTVKVLRPHCIGRVHPTLIDSTSQVFAFGAVDSVIHGPVGTTGTYHYEWTAPNGMAPGIATMRRNTDRGCNPLQFWLWPMKEVHEAEFTVISP